MSKSNMVDLDPNPKKKRNRRFKEYRKERKRIKNYILEFTSNGKKYQEEVKEKEANKKGIFVKALLNLMGRSGKEAKCSMPPVEEVVQIEVGTQSFDIHVFNFEDEDTLKCFEEYERFVMTNSCKPNAYKQGKHRDSQCEILKDKNYAIKVNGKMTLIHIRDVLTKTAMEGVDYMETLHKKLDRKEVMGKTCGAEGNMSPMNLGRDVVNNDEAKKILGLLKRKKGAKMKITVCGKSCRISVEREEPVWCEKSQKLLTELNFQVGNSMNRHIYGNVKKIGNVAKNVEGIAKWANTITEYFGKKGADNAGAKMNALNKTLVNTIEACSPFFTHKPGMKFEDGYEEIACNYMVKQSDKIAMHRDTPSKFACALVNNTTDHNCGGELFLAEAGFTCNYVRGDIVILDGNSLHGVLPTKTKKTRFSMVLYNNGEKKATKKT